MNKYEKVDVRDIRIDTFPKLKEVLEMYREHCYFRIVMKLVIYNYRESNIKMEKIFL